MPQQDDDSAIVKAPREAGARRSALRRAPRHSAFYLAAVVGAVVGGAAFAFFPATAVSAGMIAFFAVYLGAVAWQLPSLTPANLRAHADKADAPVGLIFVIMVAVIVVSAVSLFLVVNSRQSLDVLALTLGIVAVLLGWFAIHTMLALHYAYEYYEAARDRPKGETLHIARGLEFPGSDKPDGASFIYFSFVIGMTAQVADVSVTSPQMRRLVLWHGIFSFFFNTVILAAAVNVVISIAG